MNLSHKIVSPQYNTSHLHMCPCPCPRSMNVFGDIPLTVAAKINAFDIVKMLLPLSFSSTAYAEIKKFGVIMDSQQHHDEIFSDFERQLRDVSPDGWVCYSEFRNFLKKLRLADAEFLLNL